MKPNREVRELSRRFGIRVKRMQIIQDGVYRVSVHNRGEFCMKRMPYPPMQLRWIDLTIQRLRKAGVKRLGWRNTREKLGQTLYVKWGTEGPPYVLLPWIYGAWPKVYSQKQVRACGALLAQFHKAGKRISIPSVGKQGKLASGVSKIRADQRKLLQIINKAKKRKGGHPLDAKFRKYGDELLAMTSSSIKQLKRSSHSTLSRHDKAVLCHGDYGPTNIIINSKGLHLIDFETLCMGLRAYDIYRGVFNFCQIGHWNFSIARAFLDGYQQVTKLKRSDYTLLMALLRFPRNMCKLVEHYYEANPAIRREIERKFMKVLSYERKRGQFLRQLQVYATKR